MAAKTNKGDLYAVAISTIAVDAARKETERRKQNGIPMSLGAVISEAVMEKYGKGN